VSAPSSAPDRPLALPLVPAGLKALLEHVVRLNLVADRYPQGVITNLHLDES